MSKYHKINTIFKRDMSALRKPLIVGKFADPAIEYLKDNEWEFTEKIDGTNSRIEITTSDGNINISFEGRKEHSQIPANLINRLRELFPTDKIQSTFFSGQDKDWESSITLYGEGYGGKIQKGGKYRRNEDFILFDIKIGKWWLTRQDVDSIAAQLEIDSVPIIGRGTIQDAIEIVKAGQKSRFGDFIAEGIVARPITDLLDRSGKRIITKIKHRDFT